MTEDIDYKSLFEFRLALRKFLRFSEEAAAAEGWSPQQHQLLLALRGLVPGGWLTVTEIADALLLKHHSTVELIDRAAAKGLVAKKQHESDRRVIEVSLTPKGLEILEHLSQRHLEEIDSLRKVIPNLEKSAPL